MIVGHGISLRYGSAINVWSNSTRCTAAQKWRCNSGFTAPSPGTRHDVRTGDWRRAKSCSLPLTNWREKRSVKTVSHWHTDLRNLWTEEKWNAFTWTERSHTTFLVNNCLAQEGSTLAMSVAEEARVRTGAWPRCTGSLAPLVRTSVLGKAHLHAAACVHFAVIQFKSLVTTQWVWTYS